MLRHNSFVYVCLFAFLSLHSLFAYNEIMGDLVGTNAFLFATKDGKDFNVALQPRKQSQKSQSKQLHQSWVRFKPIFIYKDKATRQELIKKAPMLYIVIQHTAGKFYQHDLEGEEGKIKLAHALVKSINSVLIDSNGITAVTFLNFMLYKK